MHLPRIFVTVTVLLFVTIAILALIKNKKGQDQTQVAAVAHSALEIELDQSIAQVDPQLKTVQEQAKKQAPIVSALHSNDLPTADRVSELFQKGPAQLPIVETVTYLPQVKWLKGRSAWLVDYAKHYNTSRHFISRSVAGRPDYFYQKLAAGDQFNVLRQDKNFQFYLIVDISRCRMWFYYIDFDLKQSVLLKTYPVCLGRQSAERASGLLTPQGKYLLGDRIASYGPKNMGSYAGKQIEMIRVFGTRWIPFAKEISGCSESAKGFGIHGMPWKEDPASKQLLEDTSSLGMYQSDGCIRLTQPDVEELYAVIVTRPTTIEIVKDFYGATLPYAQKDSALVEVR